MSQPIIQKIFAYNTGSLISGTTQVGDIAISEASVEYSANFGGLQWWGGPDETNGYVIAHTDPTGGHNGEPSTPAYLGFWRSNGLTDQDFLDLCNSIPPRIGFPPFTNTSDAYTWLNDNGYWTSFISFTPTPTPTITSTVTPTRTTAAVTPSPTTTNTPTPTSTLTQTPTPSVTNTQTPSLTPTKTPVSATPTPTPTQGGIGNFNVTVSQVGPNVVWTGSGYFNLAALSFAGPNAIGAGFAANQAIWAIGPSTNVDTYSGASVTYPTSFGNGGVGVSSTSGSTMGVLPGGSGRLLYVPSGYTSNTIISGGATYSGQTISSMQLSGGTYTWTWTTGGNSTTVVMNIVP